MPHQEKCDAGLFCQAQQNSGGLTDLGDTSRGCLHLGAVHGLDRVDDRQARFLLLERCGNGIQICLTQKTQAVGNISDPFSSHFNLVQGFFTGNIDDVNAGGRQIAGGLQQDGGFAYAGVAAQKNHGTGDQAASQHPVKLGKAGGKALLPRLLYRGERHRFPADPRVCRGQGRSRSPRRLCRRGGFHHCIPLFAGGTLTKPFG